MFLCHPASGLCAVQKSRACCHLAGRGLRPQLACSRPAAPHTAPLAPTAAAPALDTNTFIFLNALGRKAKAKTAERRARARARGECGARARSQRRGPRASGQRAAARAAFRREPRPPERPLPCLSLGAASPLSPSCCARWGLAGGGWPPHRDQAAGGASWVAGLDGRGARL